MTYRIKGLDPRPFADLIGLTDEVLASRGIVRMTVDTRTYPCRITLRDRPIGETMLLLNHCSHDVANPYRAAHAIFVTEGADEAAQYVDEVPPVFEKRILSLRGFDKKEMMIDAILTQPVRPTTASAGCSRILKWRVSMPTMPRAAASPHASERS